VGCLCAPIYDHRGIASAQASIKACLTLPSSGRVPAGFACFHTPLMSNVNRQMKRTLALIALMLAAVSTMSAETTLWATAVSKQESTGRAIVFRYAKEFGQGFKRASFPDRVILVWKYHSESGMPTTVEREAMDRMENLLEPLIEKSGSSILALVSTGENLREWIFYSKSEREFIAALNKALDGQPKSLIEVHAAPDPSWSTYERFRKGVRE
jgi:hypothetical protein